MMLPEHVLFAQLVGAKLLLAQGSQPQAHRALALGEQQDVGPYEVFSRCVLHWVECIFFPQIARSSLLYTQE